MKIGFENQPKKSILEIEKLKAQVIKEIIAKKKAIEGSGFFADWLMYELEYGNKRLELQYNPKNYEASTYVENTGKDQMSDQTTILYESVKKILENLVENEKHNINYAIRTNNENMANWAKTKGREIFEWDAEQELLQGDFPSLHVFDKRFLYNVK